ncbi:ShET2/EspL2 family type III secretion system effector toxin [Enterobacter ludwigii]
MDTEQEDIKYTPYFSTRGDASLNLNDVVESASGDMIVCRHLAPYWEEAFAGAEKHKVDYSRFDNEDALHSEISTEKYNEMFAAPFIAQMAANNEWGNVIADTFTDMQKCGNSVKTLVIYTTNHVMALGLKIKCSPKGGDKWVIQFYDPNRTATHVRAAFPGDMPDRISTIRKLEAGDFLPDDELEDYDLLNNGVSVFRERNKAASISSTSRQPREVLHPQVMYHALYFGLTDTLQTIAEQLKKSSLLSDEKVELLVAKSGEGVPGLYVALEKGRADAIKAYGRMLNESGLTPEVIAELLAIQGPNGPGLHMALQQGHADAILAYGQILSDSGLALETLAELLAAKGLNGAGLYMPLQQGHADAIKAYGQILNGSGLAPEAIAELLAAKSVNDIPGLHIALQKGNAGAILAYGQILNGFGLAPEALAELLAAKDPDGTSGLYQALSHGHADAILAYGEILNGSGLDPETIAELLAAKDATDISGLRWAREDGSVDAIRAYERILRMSGLSSEADVRRADALKALNVIFEMDI